MHDDTDGTRLIEYSTIFIATLVTLGGRRPVDLETIVPGSTASLREAGGARMSSRTTPPRPTPVLASGTAPLRGSAPATIPAGARSVPGSTVPPRDRPRLVKS